MIDLLHRATAPERMDDLLCHGDEVHQTLRELDVINAWLGGNGITLRGLADLMARQPAGHEVTVADIGCGSGEMAIQMVQWARRNNRKLRVIGYDANPNITAFARNHTRHYPEIEIETANIFDPEFGNRHADIVTATLVLHHFSDEELVHLLRLFLRQARVGVVINDLHRHVLAYYSIRWITRLFSRSPMVQYDAPLSVARGFRQPEWRHLLARASVNNYRIRWQWAFRWQVVIKSSV